MGRLAKVRDTVHELGLVEYEKNPFGNPYHVGPLTRGEAIAAFRAWLLQKVAAQPDKWIPLLAALHGERLICHCAPLPCHASILIDASEWAFEQIGGVERLDTVGD